MARERRARRARRAPRFAARRAVHRAGRRRAFLERLSNGGGRPRGRNVPAVSRSRSSGLAAALHSPSAQGRRKVYAKCRTIGAPSLRLRDAKPARHGRVYRGAAPAHFPA
ncbi:hypothetical protein D512_23201 [Burkholderia pseudomallei MSHR1043]|nr:hypothetical protein D512_23201 [Burkholderia pseudomallei MSHR1043]